jgi:uncharacterized protein YceH (UPF0502 family)
MAQPEPTPPGLAAGPWPALDVPERRVLGVLVEKQKTSKTADAYPMSLNALTTGCNQKSNRDPALNLSEDDVEDALGRCQKKGLVMRITGGRVDRWRHLLYETWHVDRIDLAILAELLLRGPQTEGELRTRAARMEPIEDLDALRRCLRPLVERNLVVYLTPEDRRGAVLTHGFHDPRERERLKAHHSAQPLPAEVPAPIPPAPVPAPPPPPSRAEQALPALEAALAAGREETAALKRQLGELQATVAVLQKELRELKQALGV